MEIDQLKNIIEAILLAAGRPLNVDQILAMFAEHEKPERSELRDAVSALQVDYESRGIALIQVGSGYRIQVRETMKPARYTRALLETMALIAYRQPITRGEIEEVRGVSVSSTIIKTLLEREWVHVLGHREVPGRPAMYGTTRKFLDYFSLKNLSELPSLAELRDLNEIGKDLELDLSDIPGIGVELAPANDDEAAAPVDESAENTDDVVSAADTAESDNVATLH